MKKSLSFSIVAALLLGTVGCADRAYHQDRLAQISDEPSLVIEPFKYSGKAWFDTDKATLRPSAKAELNGLAQQLMAAKQQGLISEANKVVVVGHTDSRASYRYNQKLSERRANAVANYLKNNGIPSSVIMAMGKGETQPVASNRTAAGMQQNRRVEVHIQGNAIHVVAN